MICDDVRGKLDSYIDSELSAGELAGFETHLRGCASCAAAALAAMKMKYMTRAAAACYSPSPEFRLRMERSMRASRKHAWLSGFLPRFGLAATAAVLLIATVLLWTNHAERERAYAELTDLHVAALASPNPVDVVSTDRHTVKPWFAGRIPFTFDLPELQNSEFTLIGGRLVYFQHNPGAQLLFHVRKHQISVFIFRENAGVQLTHGESDATRLAFHTETWSSGGLRYYIISDASAADVHNLGELMKGAARH